MKKFFLVALGTIISSLCFAYHQPEDLSIEASKNRMAPPSRVVVSGEASNEQSVVAAVEPGQPVYKKFCQVCHASGVAGAPKVGNTAQWTARYKDGWPVMMKRAMQGYKGMPAKGHCMKCSEAEIKEAIEFMLKNSQVEE